MPTRIQAPVGAPCWIDYATSDIPMARSFYPEVFGWTAGEQDEQFGGYFQFFLDGSPVAGCAPNISGGHQDDCWSVYLRASDTKATLARATERGATIVVPDMQVADLGTMAVIRDVSGAHIGLWEPNAFHGFGRYDEQSTPKWFELLTKEYATSIEFYKAVFGWETKVTGDTPDFRYTIEVHGEEELAGIMDASSFLPVSVPSHWAVYFEVASADATLEKVTRLGGSISRVAQDTPFGRLAGVTDPSGAEFKIMQAM